FEYNGSGASIQYCVAVGAGNPSSQATAAIVAAPTTSASAITFSSIQCNQVTVSWANGNGANRIVVAKSGSAVTGTPVNASGYSANSSFSSGSAIAAGEYVVYSGSGSSVTVTSLNASSTYFFKVFEDNGSTGCESYKTTAPPSSSVATISCVNQIPYMVSGVINACGGSCGEEGSNELLFFTSGSYSIPVNPANMVLTYGSSAAPTKVFNGSFTSNAAETANLNAQVGCSGFFIDAVTAGTIPANSLFFFVNTNYCDGAYDWTNLCASGWGPLYVVYVNDPAWVSGSTAGNYANSASGSSLTRYFRTDFSAVTGGGTSGITDYSYLPNSLVCDCDGASVTWSSAGGAPSQYVSPNSCAFAKAILPIELIGFAGKRTGINSVLVNWVTASETNNASFTLDRANEEGAFEFVGSLKGAGNSSRTLNYSFTDDNAPSGICYYRLHQTDFNGTETFSQTIAIQPFNHFALEQVYPNPASDQLNVAITQESSNNLEISISDVLGNCVYKTNRCLAERRSIFSLDISDLPQGVYILKVTGTERTYQHKFIKH
ncbi:MAG TPA: T9SS type A sorting domain-containing protein, partial [Bacteroidia bacterium]|nr:T9SS type A sorting domain-containing protein [Bacteroidia bacterium]